MSSDQIIQWAFLALAAVVVYGYFAGFEKTYD